MKMKKLLIVLILILSTALYASAQKIPTATELATKSMDALDKKMTLNPTQRNIIYNYNLELFKAQLEYSKKQQAGQSNEDDITKMYKLQNQTTANIKNILKGEQLDQYDAFLEEQLRGGAKKKKKGKNAKEEEEVVTGISGLKSGSHP
jgi:protein CpxP